ncbi:MAG: TonB family protein [Acidobacteria bacterium]|nr:TonB family protein [Acidobacteriota bacterium]
MRSRRLFSSALLIGLAASAAAAQTYTSVWLRVAPEDEEFAVHFPEPNFRIRRELPFGGGVTLKPASFEVTHDGALLSVLSFAKSAAGTPKSLDAFIKGFQRALGAGAAMEFERQVELDGNKGRQFRLRLGEDVGSARVFETGRHFYVVLTYGVKEAAGVAERFHSSFSLDPSAADRVALRMPSSSQTFSTKQPASLWPVAGGGPGLSVLVVGTTSEGPAPPPDGASGIDVSKTAGRMVVKGGVLNGKAIVKPQPMYPPIAKAARAQGLVTVQVVVDEEGYVIAAFAVSGHPLLQQAAVFAARQARFTPTLLSGQPVKVSGVITYNFVLQ